MDILPPAEKVKEFCKEFCIYNLYIQSRMSHANSVHISKSFIDMNLRLEASNFRGKGMHWKKRSLERYFTTVMQASDLQRFQDYFQGTTLTIYDVNLMEDNNIKFFKTKGWKIN